MSDQNVQAQPEAAGQTAAEFDYAEWKKQYEARLGGQAPAKQPGGGTETKPAADGTKTAKAETKPANSDTDGEDEGDDETPAARLPRSITRRLNKLQRENGELAGRLAMLQELQAAGATKTEAKQQVAQAESEPQRMNFASDAEYYRALGRFEAKSVLAEDKAKEALQASQASQMQLIEERNAQFAADAAEYDDWDEAIASMGDVIVDFGENEKHQHFVGLLSEAPNRAAVLYHFSKNRAELAAILDMPQKAQNAAFHRLEGKLEKVHTEEQPDEKKPEKKAEAKPTAAELDAKKAKPSSAVGARGGSAVPAKTPMLLADGVTLNPQYKAEQAAKLGFRP